MKGERIPDFSLDYGLMSNVYNVRTSAGQGTCFIYERGNLACFVSAAHVFKNVQEGEVIYFANDNEWKPFALTQIARHPYAPDVDVCCFIVDNPPILHQTKIVDPDKLAVFPGEEVKFVGFPHGLSITPLAENDYKRGLVRTAFLSGVIDQPERRVWIYDGFNNPGYSGGPIYKNVGNREVALCGLISGFRHEKQEIGQLFKIESGEEVELEGHFVKRLNSGMIYALGISEIRATFVAISYPYQIDVNCA